jgi:hypothetical protein
MDHLARPDFDDRREGLEKRSRFVRKGRQQPVAGESFVEAVEFVGGGTIHNQGQP